MPPKQQGRRSENASKSGKKAQGEGEGVAIEEVKKRKGTSSFEKTRNKLLRVNSESQRNVNKVMSLTSLGIQRQQSGSSSSSSSSSGGGGSSGSSNIVQSNDLDRGVFYVEPEAEVDSDDEEGGEMKVTVKRSQMGRRRRSSIECVHGSICMPSNPERNLVRS